MKFDTFAKKTMLAVLIAYTSVVWLSVWHQYGFSRSPITFPPVSNWPRDMLIILLPVALTVWLGGALSQWLIGRSNGQMTLSTQSMLAAAILAVVTTAAIILVEGSRLITTGIGIEFLFLATICGQLYPNGNLVLNILRSLFPVAQALRLHILLQDGFNLALVNLALAIFLTLILEGLAKFRGIRVQVSG